jgi:hypothetical protein
MAVGLRRVDQVSGIDIAGMDHVARRDRRARKRELAHSRQRADNHRREGVGRAVVRVAKPEVCKTEDVRRYLVRAHGRIGAFRGVVQRVEGRQLVRGRA